MHHGIEVDCNIAKSNCMRDNKLHNHNLLYGFLFIFFIKIHLFVQISLFINNLGHYLKKISIAITKVLDNKKRNAFVRVRRSKAIHINIPLRSQRITTLMPAICS